MTMTAKEILQETIKTLEERGEQYDKDGEERSMPLVTKLFNLLTKHKLSTKDGLVFMMILKLVRSYAGNDKLDNYVDFAGYSALAGELLTSEIKSLDGHIREWRTKVGNGLASFYGCKMYVEVDSNTSWLSFTCTFGDGFEHQLYRVEPVHLFDDETTYEIRKALEKAYNFTHDKPTED